MTTATGHHWQASVFGLQGFRVPGTVVFRIEGLGFRDLRFRFIVLGTSKHSRIQHCTTTSCNHCVLIPHTVDPLLIENTPDFQSTAIKRTNRFSECLHCWEEAPSMGGQ